MKTDYKQLWMRLLKIIRTKEYWKSKDLITVMIAMSLQAVDEKKDKEDLKFLINYYKGN